MCLYISAVINCPEANSSYNQGRGVEEALRTVDALQYIEKNGEVCPAYWKEGEKAIRPTQEGVAEYMSGPTQ